MGERAIITYPATSIHYPLANIASVMAKSILKTFPTGIIPEDNFYVNTRNGIKDYRKGKNGNEGVRHLERPRLLVSMSPVSNPDEKNAGFSSTPRIKYPSQFLDKNIIGHGKDPIYRDNLDIVLSTIQIRRKMVLEFLFELNSAGDQESVRSLIYNTFKINELDYFFDINSDIILPAIMMKDIKKILYGNLNNNPIVNDDFQNRLTEYSKEGIKFLRLGDDDTKTFIVYNQLWNRIAFVVNEPDINEGDKVGKANDVYTVSFSMEIEAYFPNTYIINAPSMISGTTMIGDVLFKSKEVDFEGNMMVAEISNNFNDTTQRGLETKEQFVIHTEEFFMAGITDYISFRTFLPQEYLIILDYGTEEEVKRILDMRLYEADHLVDNDYITIEYSASDKDLIYHITECDVIKNYYLEILCNTDQLRLIYPQLFSRRANAS